MSARQALHWVFKVPSPRAETMRFYREILGMKILRHEEFEKGCEAACNGPYDGRWSKTMVGYGAEDTHFVVELTYNYNISSYKLGNDFQGITIQSSECLERAEKAGWPVKTEEGRSVLEAPGGYKFFIIPGPQPTTRDPVVSVGVAVSDMTRSTSFWSSLLDMRVTSASLTTTSLSYDPSSQASLVLVTSDRVDHAKAQGRIAFSLPSSELPGLQEKILAANEKILTPLISLDTPGKATVQVVIIADPDGQEICFVGCEAFRELSQVDPQADKLLQEAMESDKSDEWFAKKGREKAEA